jgi:hypothetical protein
MLYKKDFPGRNTMDLQEEIRRVAYELYEKSGRIRGRELENWTAAEKIVMARYAQKEKSRKVEPPPATQQERKTPARSKGQKAEAPKAEPKGRETRKPGAKKTGPQKTVKTGR